MPPELRNTWEWLSSSLWFVPAIMIVLTFTLACFTLSIDQNNTNIGQQAPFRWVYTGGAEGAREILSTIAGTMINIAALSFSITLITLTLASSQYGHRLLRSFVSDLGTQVVLGTFVSTFVYSMFVLRFVRTETAGQVFVPHVSVTTAMILSLASIGVLIFFIHHIVSTVQVENLASRIGKDLKTCICRLYPPRGEGQDAMEQSEEEILQTYFQGEPAQVLATKEGYIQTIDYNALLNLACTYDLIVKMNCRPGQFIIKGGVLAEVVPDTPVNRHLDRQFCGVFIVGKRRTSTLDIEFTVEQLSEVAVRALSTGINSPYTAVICIDHLKASLSLLVQRAVPETLHYDTQGNIRLIIKRSSYTSIFDQAFNAIRQTARNVPVVTIRLLEAITQIGGVAGDNIEAKSALRQHAIMIYEDSQDATVQPRDREDIHHRYYAALEALQ